jgi:hypothetical protein
MTEENKIALKIAMSMPKRRGVESESGRVGN